jgi:hypothetical protein
MANGAQRLKTHPGVGPLTALAFVLMIGKAALAFALDSAGFSAANANKL